VPIKKSRRKKRKEKKRKEKKERGRKEKKRKEKKTMREREKVGEQAAGLVRGLHDTLVYLEHSCLR
jgi:hypothetical protein